MFTRYGPPEVLHLAEVPQPVPADDEVLVRVRATAVNDWDWNFVRGRPVALRPLFGRLRPEHGILGVDVAGQVESVGADVTRFRAGDEVYGDLSEAGFGAFAEYVSAPEHALAIKPSGMSFEQAATVPHAANLAVQGLVDAGGIRPGMKVLINGGGGGVGMFGVQIARAHDAEVTGVDSADKAGMMRELGFDHVIDYRCEDFTRNGRRYDLILDAKTTRAPWSYLRSLAPGGTYATVGGHLDRLVLVGLAGRLFGRFGTRTLRVVALQPNKDLDYVSQLYEAGQLRFVIDGPFELSQVAEAVKRFGEAKHQGKVVIAV